MNNHVENTLWKYLFPVQEKKVYFEGDEGKPVLTMEYKSITREDNNRLISVMNDMYKLVATE